MYKLFSTSSNQCPSPSWWRTTPLWAMAHNYSMSKSISSSFEGYPEAKHFSTPPPPCPLSHCADLSGLLPVKASHPLRARPEHGQSWAQLQRLPALTTEFKPHTSRLAPPITSLTHIPVLSSISWVHLFWEDTTLWTSGPWRLLSPGSQTAYHLPSFRSLTTSLLSIFIWHTMYFHIYCLSPH